VVHCADSEEEIANAIEFALSDEGQQVARESENPYYQPDTVELMVDAIMNTDLSTTKKFLRHKAMTPIIHHTCTRRQQRHTA